MLLQEEQFLVPEPQNPPIVPGPSKPVTRSATASAKAPKPEIELGILLKFIKPFDGNREKLKPFIYNCQSAFSRAESVHSIKEFDSFEQFVQFLKQQFGEQKHYTHLLSELQDSKQQYNESVNNFGLRIETCLAKLLTEINISIPTKMKSELAGRVATMEDLALHSFIMVLQLRFSQVVRCRNPTSLNAAVNFAVAEEKLLHNSGKKTQRQLTNNDMVAAIICRYCKNIGHSIENCRKREYNNSRRPTNPQSQSSQPRRITYIVDEDDQYNSNEQGRTR
ncbi:hypothetical protein ABMA27_003383 [Loxostege sticticalis]|uniref:Gag protein n=1 Tax=Loxostege sticticalis TaxID=481309 RepID=A0ABR3HSW9_LOXSC